MTRVAGGRHRAHRYLRSAESVPARCGALALSQLEHGRDAVLGGRCASGSGASGSGGEPRARRGREWGVCGPATAPHSPQLGHLVCFGLRRCCRGRRLDAGGVARPCASPSSAVCGLRSAAFGLRRGTLWTCSVAWRGSWNIVMAERAGGGPGDRLAAASGCGRLSPRPPLATRALGTLEPGAARLPATRPLSPRPSDVSATLTCATDPNRCVHTTVSTSTCASAPVRLCACVSVHLCVRASVRLCVRVE